MLDLFQKTRLFILTDSLGTVRSSPRVSNTSVFSLSHWVVVPVTLSSGQSGVSTWTSIVALDIGVGTGGTSSSVSSCKVLVRGGEDTCETSF